MKFLIIVPNFYSTRSREIHQRCCQQKTTIEQNGFQARITGNVCLAIQKSCTVDRWHSVLLSHWHRKGIQDLFVMDAWCYSKDFSSLSSLNPRFLSWWWLTASYKSVGLTVQMEPRHPLKVGGSSGSEVSVNCMGQNIQAHKNCWNQEITPKCRLERSRNLKKWELFSKFCTIWRNYQLIRLSTAIMANAVCREGGLVTTSQSIFKMVLRPWTFFVPEFLKFSAYWCEFCLFLDVIKF